MIDLTLDRLKRPAITGLVPSFGTTVEVTEKNKGGLSTTEVDANMALAYELQREVNVSTSDTTSIVEHDAKVALIGDEAITLTLQGASYGGCELKITNRGSQTATVVYNDSDRIEVEPTDHLRMVWTAREWWVENAKTPQEQGTNIQTYTYVVDSDQALIDWANNDRNKGQDYTSVLIKRGTWTSIIGVNLTNAGTKVVVGEADSRLVFNGVEKGLFYTNKPKGSEYYMLGVYIECTGYVYTSENDKYMDITCRAFEECNNLTNCTAITTCDNDGVGYEGNAFSNAYGFYECNNLTNCTATTNAKNHFRGQAYGFYKCYNLISCIGKGSGANIYEQTNGFGRGFEECKNLTSCMGVGIGNKNGFAFYRCFSVTKCKSGGNSTTTVLYECWASSTENSNYVCADTPAGGFNNTTNPSA